MWPSLLQFLVSALVIVAAGSVLTRFGDIISHGTKLGGLLVGGILISSATSLPELSIDIHAVRLGAPDLAAGDLFGSSLINLLILAVLDLTRYSHGEMLSKRSAHHALIANVSIILTAIPALAIFLAPRMGSFEIAGLAPANYFIVAAYIVGIRLIYHSGPSERDRESTKKAGAAAHELPGIGRIGVRGAIIGFLGAAAVILIAAPFLASAAEDLAERSGLGGTFFGTTFVALCTALPEIVTTFSAVRMRALDMALGNILGSNCFNMLIFIPLDWVHAGPIFAAVSPSHVCTAVCSIIVTCVVILGQLSRVERRKPLLEPDALLVIALIIGAFTGLYFLR